MENWQRDRIATNIYHLVLKTTCSERLIEILSEEGVVSTSDVEKLNHQKDKANHEMEKSLLFYNIILSSKSSRTYSVLLKGLRLTEQKEALEILKPQNADEACVNGNTKTLPGGIHNCTIEAVVEEMKQASIGSFLVKNWTQLAIKLSTPGFELEVLRQDLVYGKKTHLEVIADVLEIWQTENKDDATFPALVEVIKDLGWVYMAECLQIKFSPPNQEVECVQQNLGKLAVEKT